MKSLFLVAFTLAVYPPSFGQKKVQYDSYGAIIRGDSTQKEIALVFVGHEFTDGLENITSVLWKQQMKASFFFSGRVYQNFQLKKQLTTLRDHGHYLGPHSDQYLNYGSASTRDSLKIAQHMFTLDLLNNFEKITPYASVKNQARYFVPPYLWYNQKIVEWSKGLEITLLSYTPGTYAISDDTYPELGNAYISSETIYQSILNREKKYKNGLNGFILLFHSGTDPRRPDKFYLRIDQLLSELKRKGYKFVRVDDLL